MLRAGLVRNKMQFPAVQDVSPLHVFQAGSGAHPASYPMGTGAKRPGRVAGHSPPSNALVKNVWNYTSPPPYVFMA
jgi:hypothetical protein